MTNQENTGFTISRFSAAYLPALDALYMAVYRKAPPADYFSIKYNTGHTGHSYIGFIAFASDGTPAGYYGVIPCRMQYEGRVVLAAQSADTMTHPAYRFKGMFVSLSLQTFDLCKLEGIEVLFGFPNQHSLHGAVSRLNWQLAHTMDVFTLKVAGVPFSGWCSRLRVTAKLYGLYRNACLRMFASGKKGLPASVQRQPELGWVIRDDDYLRQKDYHQRFVLQLGEALVWVKPAHVLTIGDMHVAAADFRQTLKKLTRLAAWLGIGTIHFQCSPGTGLHGMFSRVADRRPSFPVLFQVFATDIDITKFRFTFADIDIF